MYKITHTNKIVSAILLLFIVVGVFAFLLPVEPVLAQEIYDSGKDLAAGTGALAGLGRFNDFIFGNLLEGITGIFAWLASWVLAAGGYLLDVSIKYSIETQNLKLPGIMTAWDVVRDVANMTFIFILVYIAIATILQVGGFDTKRTLSILIVVALLVNFSFFLTGVVIDASNILSLTIYNSLNSGNMTISEQFSNALAIESAFDSGAFETAKNYQLAIFNLLKGIFFLAAGFVFLAAAIMFIIRTLYLMWALVLSPIAFAAAVLPKTKQYFDKWLHGLIHNSFVAPLFLLLVLIVLKIIEGGDIITQKVAGVTQTKSVGTLAGAFSSNPLGQNVDSFAIILVFFLIIGLIIGALEISKQFAGGLADISVKYAGKATGFASGGAAALGRRTVGRASHALAESEWMKEKATAHPFLYGKMGKGLAEYGAKATFDVRSTGIASATAGKLGTDFGRAGGRGGYSAIRKSQIDEERKRAEGITKEGMDKTERKDENKLLERLRKAESESEKLSVRAELEAFRETTKTNMKNRSERRRELLAEHWDTRRGGPFMSAEAKRELAAKIRGGRTEKEKSEKSMKDFFEKLLEESNKET